MSNNTITTLTSIVAQAKTEAKWAAATQTAAVWAQAQARVKASELALAQAQLQVRAATAVAHVKAKTAPLTHGTPGGLLCYHVAG